YSGDNQTCSYTHDDMTRIASANCGTPWAQTFSYDAFGNISKSGTVSFQPTYSHLTNQMTEIGSSTPTYDANGNVTNDFLHTYTWDAAARPVTADGVGLTYDALGRMVEQNRSSVYTEIVYGPGGHKLALMSAQTLQKAFVPLTGGSMAVYNSGGLAYYRHSDWLGSSRFASTPTRTMYADGAYAPFGEAYAQSGTADLSYTGMNQDTVANLYDFPAREYGTQGRWPSPDPAGMSSSSLKDPQTWNRYAYVRNSPLHAVDPQGLKTFMLPSFGGGGMLMQFLAEMSSIDEGPDSGTWDFMYNNTSDPDTILPDQSSSGTGVSTNGQGGGNNGTDSSDSAGSMSNVNCQNSCNAAPPVFPILGEVYCAQPGCTDAPDVSDDSLNPSALAIFQQINQMNLQNSILELYSFSVVAGASPFAPEAWESLTSVYSDAQATLIMWQAAGELGSYQEAEDLVLGMASPFPGATLSAAAGSLIGCLVTSCYNPNHH
ncbi:MAG: RHS repeat-associated core domain-containing protein, partial [Candidatus Acidiferrales bacterium]